MAAADIAQSRRGSGARRHHKLAARREAAARRQAAAHRRHQLGHRAGNGLQPHLVRCCHVDARNAAYQPLCVRVARPREEVLHGGLFDDLAGIHHHHPLRHLGHHAHCVRDEHHRHAHLGLQPGQQVEDLRLDGDVQRRRGLVGNQQLRPAGQRNGNHHALAHAAAELVRVVLDAPFGRGNVHPLEHLHRAVHGFRAAQTFVQAHAFGDLVAHRVDRVQARHRLLENDGDFLGAHLLHLGRGQRHEVAALPQHLAADDPARWHVDELHHRLGRHALAAAAFADDAECFAGIHLHVDTVHRVQPAVVGLEVGLQAFDLQQGHRQARPAARWA